MKLNTTAYREAIGHRKDIQAPFLSLAYQWQDKPHRLIYDLCNEVDRLQLALDKALKLLWEYDQHDH